MRSLVFSLALVFAAPLVHAADGSSGCGPGWYVLKDNSLVSSALRAVTNGILFPVTTIGMTVGTSNCTRHQLVLHERESLHYALMNLHELKAEGARGEGVYLSGFSDVVGCGANARARFAGHIQKNYERVFRTSGPESVLTETYKVILADPLLVRSCSLGQG